MDKHRTNRKGGDRGRKVGADQVSGRLRPAGSERQAVQGSFSGCSGRGDFEDVPLDRAGPDLLAEKRMQRRTNTLPDVSKGARTMTELWDHVAKTYCGKPSTFASYEHRWRNHVQPALGSAGWIPFDAPISRLSTPRSRPRHRSTLAGRCSRSSTRCWPWRCGRNGS